jgi:hypothetical protein
MISNKKTFTAVLEKADDGKDTAFVSIPFDVEKAFGSKGHLKVKATFDGHPYHGLLANMGTGFHIIGVRKAIRQAIGKQVGDSIKVVIALDTDDRIVDVPDDLVAALEASKKAKAFFDTLSYTNRKEYAAWILSAKKRETRLKRLALTIQKLLVGLRNPSEKI